MPDTLTFDHYEVLKRADGSLYELGRGAMGITYKAFDTNLRMPVALKVINSTYLNSDVARQRFIREARSAAKLRHRHVASVFHLGTDGEAYFYAMEYIDGETVDGLIKRQGPLSPVLALQIVDQVARALNAAQPHGLVHRDIKPANLMLVREDDELVVKVIDFGLAKSFLPGEGEDDSATLSVGGFVGTPHFASPEQLEEKIIDVRSDIYSLGVTLWYMLAGQTPFAGSMAQVMSQHLAKPPPFEKLLNVPQSVANLLRRMLEKDPANRPQTPSDLRKEIDECVQHLNNSSTASAAAPIEADENFATILDDSSLRTGETHFEVDAVVAGRYRITANLGDTNAGRLFCADQISPSRAVRLLVLHRELTTNPLAYTQIEREVEKIAPVQHPNIMRVYALETVDAASFVVLEAINGFSLLELLRARRELSATELLTLLPQAADGVDHARTQGLKRLDLALHQIFITFNEPIEKESIMRTAVGQWPQFAVKLNPLGITQELSASETWAGGQTVVGGMAPQTGPIDDERASMIQALGAVVYELLGGTLSPLLHGPIGTHRYTPLATLSEKGNEALKLALGPNPPYQSAYNFYRALAELAEIEVPRMETRVPAPRSPSSTVVRSSPPTVTPTAPTPTVTPPPMPIPPIPAVAPPPRRAPAPAAPTKKFPLKFFGSIATVALIGGLVFFATKGSKKQVTDNPPVTTPIESGPTPVPNNATPSPDAPPIKITLPTADNPPAQTQQELVKSMISEAEAAENNQAWPDAVATYLKAAKEYPQFEIGKTRLEMLLERLRVDEKPLNPDLFAALRQSLMEAAQLDVTSAMMMLAENSRKTEPAKAFNWYSAAAAKGQLQAMTQMGLMLSNGVGTQKDLARAIEALREASEKGHPPAKAALAECYLYGKGVPKDDKRAIELLQEAVDKGYPRAMDLLGSCYQKGVGVATDFDKAFSLFTQAADLDYVESYGNLGIMYILGKGNGMKEPNPQKAVQLFQKGVSEGNAYCMYLYARCLENGIGVGRNLLQARAYYKKSAEAGNHAAADWCREHSVDFFAPN